MYLLYNAQVKNRVTISLSDEAYRKLRVVAATENVSMAEIVERLLNAGEIPLKESVDRG